MFNLYRSYGVNKNIRLEYPSLFSFLQTLYFNGHAKLINLFRGGKPGAALAAKDPKTYFDNINLGGCAIETLRRSTRRKSGIIAGSSLTFFESIHRYVLENKVKEMVFERTKIVAVSLSVDAIHTKPGIGLARESGLLLGLTNPIPAKVLFHKTTEEIIEYLAQFEFVTQALIFRVATLNGWLESFVACFGINGKGGKETFQKNVMEVLGEFDGCMRCRLNERRCVVYCEG